MSTQHNPEDEREAGAVPHDVGGTTEDRVEASRRAPWSEKLNPDGGEYVDRSSHSSTTGEDSDSAEAAGGASRS